MRLFNAFIMRWILIFMLSLALCGLILTNKAKCLKCSQLESKLIKANKTIKTLQDTLDGAIIIYKQQ